ncbi:MAG: hypothetical protein PHH55_06310, partial [Candidatus Delongbacteria bacterium]|nr:hypothetical protein [Candidatus Delongbacteria bacterium]
DCLTTFEVCTFFLDLQKHLNDSTNVQVALLTPRRAVISFVERFENKEKADAEAIIEVFRNNLNNKLTEDQTVFKYKGFKLNGEYEFMADSLIFSLASELSINPMFTAIGNFDVFKKTYGHYMHSKKNDSTKYEEYSRDYINKFSSSKYLKIRQHHNLSFIGNDSYMTKNMGIFPFKLVYDTNDPSHFFAFLEELQDFGIVGINYVEISSKTKQDYVYKNGNFYVDIEFEFYEFLSWRAIRMADFINRHFEQKSLLRRLQKFDFNMFYSKGK